MVGYLVALDEDERKMFPFLFVAAVEEEETHQITLYLVLFWVPPFYNFTSPKVQDGSKYFFSCLSIKCPTNGLIFGTNSMLTRPPHPLLQTDELSREGIPFIDLFVATTQFPIPSEFIPPPFVLLLLSGWWK